jgi:hypothetical protein
MKKKVEDPVTVEKTFFLSDRADYSPCLYAIEVDSEHITMKERAARKVYEDLGRLLNLTMM